MRVVIFLVCLCSFLIIKKADAVCAGISHYNIFSAAAQPIEETSSKKGTYTNQHPQVIKQTPLHEQQEHLIIDIEEEEANDVTARKYKLLGNCHSPIAFTFMLQYAYSRVKDRLPLYSHLSYKYIIQRALRI